MAGISKNFELQDEVAAAVAASLDANRSEIVKRFLGRGVSQASLYAWVDRAMTELAMDDVRRDRSSRGIIGISREPIRFHELLNELISDMQALRAMAKRGDRIVSPKLLLAACDHMGKTLDRAARIGVIIQSVEADQAFIKGLVDVIHKQPPHIREPILDEMRALGHGAIL